MRVREIMHTYCIHNRYKTHMYSVPHEESKRMLGMCDVTSIAVAKQNGRQNTDLTQRGATLVAVYGSRGNR